MNLPLTQHLFRIAFLLTLLLPALLFAAPPAATTLTAPAGSLSDSQPVFSWDAVPNATWYKVWIERNGETYVKEWVQASTTWQPAANLPDGDYTWWVKTWNAEGNGPWSAPGAFQIAGNIPGAPGATTPISPSGLITNPQPTFSWNAVTNATWYKVRIDKDGAEYSADWIEGSTSWQPAEALLPGIYTWWVKTWGPDGTGPWSAPEYFIIDTNLPAATSLLVPTGLITNPQPLFQWTAVENATSYKIQINRNGEVHTLEWINGATAWTPAANLPAGDYSWWVKTWNADGKGPWSAEETFTVVVPGTYEYQVVTFKSLYGKSEAWQTWMLANKSRYQSAFAASKNKPGTINISYQYETTPSASNPVWVDEADHMDAYKRMAEGAYPGYNFNFVFNGNTVSSYANVTAPIAGSFSYAAGKNIYLKYEGIFNHEFAHVMNIQHHYDSAATIGDGQHMPPGDTICLMDRTGYLFCSACRTALGIPLDVMDTTGLEAAMTEIYAAYP